jgi:hypothetical protein
MNLGKQDELVAIIEKFAGSGRDLINGPAKAWLQKKFESGPAVV